MQLVTSADQKCCIFFPKWLTSHLLVLRGERNEERRGESRKRERASELHGLHVSEGVCVFLCLSFCLCRIFLSLKSHLLSAEELTKVFSILVCSLPIWCLDFFQAATGGGMSMGYQLSMFSPFRFFFNSIYFKITSFMSHSGQILAISYDSTY